MDYAQPIYDAPHVAEITPAKKGRGRSSDAHSKSRRNAALFVGAIILLGDGSACQIIGFAENGQPLCQPIPQEPQP